MIVGSGCPEGPKGPKKIAQATTARAQRRTVAAAASAQDLEPNQPAVSLDEHEKGLLTDALERAGGNQSEAAKMLRIGRDRLRYKMAKFNLH